MENIKTIENIDDSIYESENFPVKDRKRASARRKKAFLKSKRRFDLVKNDIFQGCQVLPKSEQITKGMLRKTNIMKLDKRRSLWGESRYDHKTNERLATADDKLTEFVMEV